MRRGHAAQFIRMHALACLCLLLVDLMLCFGMKGCINIGKTVPGVVCNLVIKNPMMNGDVYSFFCKSFKTKR